MPTASNIMLRVSTAQERGYLAARHGLHPAGTATSIVQLAAAHAGLHAARLPTPFVTLRTRLPGFAAKELRSALEPGGPLIKLRTCRRTLHIYPRADAAAAHAATVRQRLGACAAMARRLGYDTKILIRLAPIVRAALDAGPVPHRVLEQAVLAQPWPLRARRDTRTDLARLAVKWLWESGELVYVNAADSMHHERREYQLTTHAYPDLLLNEMTPATAIALLLRRYLSAFGPAAIEDFQWWSGLTREEAVSAVERLRPELIDVRLDGQSGPLLMLAEHEPGLRAAESLPASHVALMAYEDPTLKGFFTTRGRYVDDRHRDLLFNSIGEVRASIALAGRCVGTWKFSRAARAIDHELYAHVTSPTKRIIIERLDEMTDFLRAEPC